MADDGRTLVLYDGVCGLCSKAVQWLAAHDAKGTLHYAPLQGETTAALRQQHPEIPTDLDTVVVVDGGKVYVRSRAFLQAARHLRWPWSWGYWLRWVPRPLLDAIYAVVARVRYRLFGRFDACMLPGGIAKARLLP
jgi:predicted DCC family thiol-disulfide oxidoreductase YuxK